MDEINLDKDAIALVTAILDVIDEHIQKESGMAGLDPQLLEADLEQQIVTFSPTNTRDRKRPR